MGLLDGRVVIVTGAGRGLGRSHALELARNGATVVVNDLGVSVRGEQEDDVSPAEEVVAEIEAMGGTAVTNGASVTDYAAMAALVADTVERFGDLHAVVNNAGFLRDRMLTSMTEDDFDAVVMVHLKGAFALTRHACAYWKDRSKAGLPVTGRVVNTTSGSGLFGNVGQSNYGAAKSGVATFTQIVAMEMVRYGVTANAISPIAATRMLAQAGLSASDGTAWDRLDPANASPVVAWLCAAESGWLTGQILRIDGHQLQRVSGWHVDASYPSAGGEMLRIDEIEQGMRKMYGTFPQGLVVR